MSDNDDRVLAEAKEAIDGAMLGVVKDSATGQAEVVVAFYATLKDGGLPKELASDLTQAWFCDLVNGAAAACELDEDDE